MTTPTILDTVLSALDSYAPGRRNEVIERLAAGSAGRAYIGRSESYGWCETALVAAWHALGFEPVVSPGWGKPFDSSAEDDAGAFAVAARVIGNERFQAEVLRAIDESTDAGDAFVGAGRAVSHWIATTAIALAAEAYAQCGEDMSDEDYT